MDNTVSSRSRQRRAKALSLGILVSMLSGLAPMSSQAADVVVEATVENCNVSISTTGPIDLGPPTIDNLATPFNYVFNTATSDNFQPFTVDWATSGPTDCAGSLHAEHSGISKGVSPVTSAWISLSDDDFNLMDQSINQGTTVSVADSAASGLGDLSTFDVKMMVSSSEGAGTYTTTLSFTVVLD